MNAAPYATSGPRLGVHQTLVQLYLFAGVDIVRRSMCLQAPRLATS